MSPRFRTAAISLFAVCVAVSQPGRAAEKTADFTSANNAFASDLYGRLSGETGNIFFSPASVSTALAMAGGGARGNTAAQIDKVLHFGGSAEKAQRSAGDLMRELNGVGGKSRAYQLGVANALWAQKGIDFNPSFARGAKSNFGAMLNEVDFLGNAEGARRTINDWVEKATRDRITNLIPQGGVGEDTRMVLTNAIYFKGIWSKPFDKTATTDQPFQVSSSAKVKVATMHENGIYGYVKGDGFQVLRLPYKSGELSMLVLLPNSAKGLAKVEKAIASGNLSDQLSKVSDREVEVWLPKFRITGQFELSKPLTALGLTDAFTGKADFTGVTGAADLRLSAVVHKAFIEVNEEGTEAAAATGLMELGAGPGLDSKPPVFRADHPFAFLIRHEKTGAILFAGRISDPRSGAN